MEPLTGKTLGSCRIIAELGRGGMAIVYKAYQASLERYVALKVLPPQFTLDAEFVRRFQNEARAAAKLKHPNIVTIYDVGEQSGYHYIVEEFVEGINLTDLIRQHGPLPAARAADITLQVAAALDYAHALGFIHRDVKPGNILIGANDHATLTDFGIAKAAEGTRVTRTGVMVGTPEYMSPEQIRGQGVDARADVYALGIVAYEILAGRVPFEGDTARVLYAQVNERPPDLPTRGQFPAAVQQAIGGALEKDRERRYATAGQFAQTLEAATRGVIPATVEQEITPTRAMGQPAARGWLYFAAGVALLLFLWLVGSLLFFVQHNMGRVALLSPTATATLTAASRPTAAPVVVVLPSSGPTTPPTVEPIAAPTVAPTVAPTARPTDTPYVIVVTATPRPATATRVEPTATLTEPVPPPTSVSPRGRIAFSVNRGEFNNDKEIWVMNADGTNPHRILDTASNPAYSPDGSRLAYYRWGDGLYVANADGTKPVKLFANTNIGLIEWSHNNYWIAYSAWPPKKDWIKTVDIIGADGQGQHTLLAGEQPSWSPDDSQLAINTCVGSGCGIFRAGSAGGDPIAIATDAGGLPAWSPDGRKIVYQKEVDGQNQLFVVNPDGSGKRQLTSGGAMRVDAAWSPDGEYIFYRSPEGGSWGIWRMRADGTNPVLLIANVPPVFWAQERLAVTR